jgi:hypothetical protein
MRVSQQKIMFKNNFKKVIKEDNKKIHRLEI